MNEQPEIRKPLVENISLAIQQLCEDNELNIVEVMTLAKGLLMAAAISGEIHADDFSAYINHLKDLYPFFRSNADKFKD